MLLVPCEGVLIDGSNPLSGSQHPVPPALGGGLGRGVSSDSQLALGNHM
jgi:hypothetical protein